MKHSLNGWLIAAGIAPALMCSAADDPALIAKGQLLFESKICAQCHQYHPDKPALAGVALKAPAFLGDFWGKDREVTTGFGGAKKTVKFDEAYFLESVREPGKLVVVGAAAAMPQVPGVSDEEMLALAAFTRSLGQPAAAGGAVKGSIKNLSYKIYEGDWVKLPDFAKLTPKHSGTIAGGLIDINLSKVRDGFAMVFEGEINATKQGNYSFRIASDDGSRLLIGDKVVVAHDGVHPPSEKTGQISLAQGTHKIRVEYFEAGGGEELAVSMSGPGFNNLALSKGQTTVQNTAKGHPTGIPIEAAGGEAVIYRNFIEGASPRGVGVGYPEKVNLCFDANTLQVAMIWQGAFMDGARHWKDRGVGFQPPSGYYTVNLVRDQGFAALTNAVAAWPRVKNNDSRAQDMRSLGYQLVEQQRPVFRYRAGELTIEDYCIPQGGERPSLTRQLTITGSGNIWYLAAAHTDIVAKDGAWKVGKNLKITLSAAPAVPVLRENGGRKELLVPLKVDGKTVIRQQYQWDLE